MATMDKDASALSQVSRRVGMLDRIRSRRSLVRGAVMTAESVVFRDGHLLLATDLRSSNTLDRQERVRCC